VPSQQRARRDEECHPSLAGQDTGQRQQHPIARLKVRTADLSAKHRDLMAQYQKLDVLGGVPSSP
jgi:hypothetical protein